MTEKEKMIKGELYDAGDVTLVTERTACKELCYDIENPIAVGNPCWVVKRV